MITERQVGQLLGKLIVALICILNGYAFSVFITTELDPRQWSELARAAFLVTIIFVHSRLFRHEK